MVSLVDLLVMHPNSQYSMLILSPMMQEILDYLNFKLKTINHNDNVTVFIIGAYRLLANVSRNIQHLRPIISDLIVMTKEYCIDLHKISSSKYLAYHISSLRILYATSCISLYEPDLGQILSFLHNNETDSLLKYESISYLYERLNLPNSFKIDTLKIHCNEEQLSKHILEDIISSNILNLYEISILFPDSKIASSHLLDLPKALISDSLYGVNTTLLCGYAVNSKDVSSTITQHLKIIHTSTTIENMRRLVQAVLLGSPIILQGEVGCGKSFLIRTLAKIMGQDSTLMELHLDDQKDAKSLFGGYICSDVPGEFIWQAGPISQAAARGDWVVIEDIDKIPIDIIAALSNLLDRRRIPAPYRNDEIEIHPSFRLFGTRTISKRLIIKQELIEDEKIMNFGTPCCENIVSMRHFYNMWLSIYVTNQDQNEISLILKASFPSLIPSLIEKLVKTYLLFNADDKDSFKLNSNFRLRNFTLRDLMKVGGRLRNLEYNHASDYLTDDQQRIALCEIVDVFAASVRDRDLFAELAYIIGNCWNVPTQCVDSYVINSNPQQNIVPIKTSIEKTLNKNQENQVSSVITTSGGWITVGRITLRQVSHKIDQNAQQFAFTKHSMRMLERVAVCVAMNEPVLLVGETGSGKTTSVQELANLTHTKLVVQNLSLSTDSSDIFGGFRPVSMRQLFLPTYEHFVSIFHDTFPSEQNSAFLEVVATTFQEQNWKKLLKAFQKASENATKKLMLKIDEQVSEESQIFYNKKIKCWDEFSQAVKRFECNLPKISNGFAFAFTEGLLVHAMRHGYWVLLDEINLASSETLQGLAGILDGQSIHLTDKGDLEPIQRHPDFRIFAAMNPPNDVGKKELPTSIRCRFTEVYVDEITDTQDLSSIVSRYLPDSVSAPVDDIVNVYLACRSASEFKLVDSANQRPRYSLRSLTRSIRAARSFSDIGIRPIRRALFEAFLLNFQTLLSESGKKFMWTFLKESLLTEDFTNDLQAPSTRPGGKKSSASDWVLIKPFWLRAGPLEQIDWALEDKDTGVTKFVLTRTVTSCLRDLSAAVAANVAPILLQGPTSVGKTSIIEYLAKRTGHKCVRINNHEHTDVQEYVGGYISNSIGHLEFKDGLLVEALRHGHWIILDELNLAPSDVLEALNRLLDDNKELLIPETGEIVKPALGFTLFATQNPPGTYGGRKPLSRAFRNRFLELSVTDLPYPEVEEIVTRSCGIPPKYSQMLVKVMQELQTRRQQSTLFLGKHGSVTLRDLIKWGRRKPQTPMTVAIEGYMLLAEKLRSLEGKEALEHILNTICKVKMDTSSLYTTDNKSGEVGSSLLELNLVQNKLREGELQVEGISGIAITASMRRLWKLVGRCVDHNEPVLLIGETGCGKTTVCQLMAAQKGQAIHILNCHQSTETADIIGGLRPVRGRKKVLELVVNHLVQCWREASNKFDSIKLETCQDMPLIFSMISNGEVVEDEIRIKGAIDELKRIKDEMLERVQRDVEVESAMPKKKAKLSSKQSRSTSIESTVNLTIEESPFEAQLNLAITSWSRYKSLFEWQDGPLIRAMISGDMFLLDEINLAEDAVIERLNSVLEQGREITLAEKGGLETDKIIAHPNFKFLATMNPGGDFGKRELSPALRSRFTEIWIPTGQDPDDNNLVIFEILNVEKNQLVNMKVVAEVMVNFMSWLNTQSLNQMLSGIQISIREVLAWAKFIAQSRPKNEFELYAAFLHGSHMVILDGLGTGLSIPKDTIREFKVNCINYLLTQCPDQMKNQLLENISPPKALSLNEATQNQKFTIGSFSISAGPDKISMSTGYNMCASSAISNLFRILRAMQINRPILLEGPPGVGKSSIVANLAAISGHRLVRINLSEHSEISDLLGSDLPTSNEEQDSSDGISNTNSKAAFAWRDGVFLEAMKNGDWVLLDELNLAPQSVLEGLNACFDHREEVFLPELGLSFRCPSTFRVFCAQNPMGEGGGRKGLPQSFLSRFSRVFVDTMSADDIFEIANEAFSYDLNSLNDYVINMVQFINQLKIDVIEKQLYGKIGGPWEFNLRDLFRWKELMSQLQSSYQSSTMERVEVTRHIISDAAYIIFVNRMRSFEDRQRVFETFKEIFGFELVVDILPRIICVKANIVIGGAHIPISRIPHLSNGSSPFVDRDSYSPIMGNLSKSLESIAHCVSLHWPVLLVGAFGSGKKRCIRNLANLTGNRLIEFDVMPSTDSTEILGSFEQSSAYRYLFQGFDEVTKCIQIILAVGIDNRMGTLSTTIFSRISEILTMFSNVRLELHKISTNNSLQSSSGFAIFTSLEKLLNSLISLLEELKTLELYQEIIDINNLIEKLTIAQSKFKSCYNAIMGKSTTGFEWIDGVVINAVENGHWLVLNNVNLCPASVLDRLNSLLEPNGTLLLTESGTGRMIVQNPNFRIFFTMDPCCGEISRAMRNRCLEISLLSTVDTGAAIIRTQASAGICFDDELFGHLISIYSKINMSSSSNNLIPKMRVYSETLRLFNLELSFGKSVSQALYFSLQPILNAVNNSREIRDYITNIRLGNEQFVRNEKAISYSRLSFQLASYVPSMIFSTLYSLGYLYSSSSELLLETFSLLLKNTLLEDNVTKELVSFALGRLNSCNSNQCPLSNLNCISDFKEIQNRIIELPTMTQLLKLYNSNIDLDNKVIFSGSDNLSHHLLLSLNLILQCNKSSAEKILSLTEYWKTLNDALVFNRFSIIQSEDTIKMSLANNQGLQSELTTLYALGYALDVGTTVADNKELQVLKTVFLLVEAVDKNLKQILSSGINLCDTEGLVSSSAKTMTEMLLNLIKQRDSLTSVLHQKISYASAQRLSISWDSMIVCLKWISKSISKFQRFLSESGYSLMQFRDNISFIESSISKLYKMIGEMWQYRIQFEKCRLWKEGGHASVPLTNVDWENLKAIRTLFESSYPAAQHFLDINIDKVSNSVGSLNRASSAVLKEWLSLYCTFYWSRTSESYYSDRSSHDVNFSTLIDALKIKMNVVNLSEKEIVEEETVMVDDDAFFDTDISSIVNFTESSTRLIEKEYDDASSLTIIACVERSVLTTFELISNYLATLLLKNDATLDDILILKDNCNFVVSMTLRFTAFSPLYLREIQTLSWCLEACYDDLNGNKRLLLNLCRSFVGCLDVPINYLYSRNIMNTYEGIDFSYGSQTLQARLYPDKYKSSQNSIQLTWCKPLFTGSIRLLQPSRTDIILRHIDIRSLFTGSSYKPVIEENSNFCALITIATSKQAKEKLLHIFRINSGISSNTYLPEEFGRVSLLCQLAIDIIYCCRDFYPIPIGNKIESIRSKLDSKNSASLICLFNDFKDLSLHTCCSNEQLGTIFEKCLQPLLDILSSPQIYNGFHGNVILIGRCWMMIGILRVFLSLPSTPVDPATVSGIKADLLNKRMTSVHVRSKARESIKDLSGGFDGTSIRDDEEKRILTLKVNKLETRRIQRPLDAESFTSVFADLHNVITSIVDIERLISLADNLVESLAIISKPSTPISQRKKIYEQILVYVKEELNWQGLAANFIDKTKQKMSDFEDIVSPIISALHNISSGLRLIAGWIFGSSDDIIKTSSVKGNKMVTLAWSNILQYPHASAIDIAACSNSSFQQAIDSVENLLLSSEYLLSRTSSHQQEAMANAYLKADDNVFDIIGPQTIFLHAIAKINYLVGGGTVNPNSFYELFNRILSKFVEDQLKVEEKLRRIQAEKDSLYKNKTKETKFESDDAKEEEEALRHHFPDHLAEFSDIINFDKFADNSVSNNTSSDNGEKQLLLQESLDDESCGTLVNYHGILFIFLDLSNINLILSARMMFIFVQKQLLDSQKIWRNSNTSNYASKDFLLFSNPPTVNNYDSSWSIQKYFLQRGLNKHVLRTAKTFHWGLHQLLAPELDQSVLGGSLMCLSTMVDASEGNRPLVSSSWLQCIFKDQGFNEKELDRDILFLLDQETNSFWNPKNFHLDPNSTEVIKAAPSLKKLFNRATELLIQFPGNELLIQVCKLSARIADFHISTPLGKMLTSMEFLLKKSLEWEQYAAKHVSLQDEMSAVSAVINQWRNLELQSWEELLRSKEIFFSKAAMKYWFKIARAIQTAPEVSFDITNTSKRIQLFIGLPILQHISPSWLWFPKKEDKGPVEDKSNIMNETSYLTKIFEIVDTFLNSSTVGQYASRLHIVRLFSLQLLQECSFTLSSTIEEENMTERTAKQSHYLLRERLSRMLVGLWRYYDQFLPAVRKFQDSLKASIQKRLKDEVKMGKWDQLNTYAVIEHSEKAHRKLNKFLREYQVDVLEYPLSAVLRKEIVGNLIDEQGDLQVAFEIPNNTNFFPLLVQNGDEITFVEKSTGKLIIDEENVAEEQKEELELPSISFDNDINSYLNVDITLKELLKSKEIWSIQTGLHEIGKLSSVYPKVVKTDALCIKIDKYMKESLSIEQSPNASNMKDLFESKCRYGLQTSTLSESCCDEIFSRIASLREEDVPKTAKQRAVNDLLSHLKEQGISHLRGMLPQEIRISMHLMTIPTPLSLEIVGDLTWWSHRPRNLFERAENYYMRNITEMNEFRMQSSVKVSQDVSMRDVQIMIGLSENLFYHTIRTRSVLGASLDEYRKLITFCDKVSIAISSPSVLKNSHIDITPTSEQLFKSKEECLSSVNVLLDYFIQVKVLVKSAQEANDLSLSQDISNDSVLRYIPGSNFNRVTQVIDNVLTSLEGIIIDVKSLNTKNETKRLIANPFGSYQLLDSSYISITMMNNCLENLSSKINDSLKEFNMIKSILEHMIPTHIVNQIQSSLSEFNNLLSNLKAKYEKAEMLDINDDVSSDKDLKDFNEIARLSSLCVDECLIVVQKIKLAAAKSENVVHSDDEEIINENSSTIVNTISESYEVIANLHIAKLANSVSEIVSLLDSCKERDPYEQHQCCLLVRNIIPLIYRVIGTYAILLEDLCLSYKSSSKLLYVCLRVFRTIVSKGLCSAETEDGDGEGGGAGVGDMRFEDDVEGTGMGEGDGKNDVSDQIQNEEQLLGLKNDKDDAKDESKAKSKKQLDEKEAEEGVEMTQDFDGDMFDLPEDKGDENNDEEEDNEEDIDREMGEADEQDIVDEKLWDGDDEDDGEEKDGKEEKFEKDSKVDGDKLDEMRTKDDDEDEGDGGSGNDEDDGNTKSKDETKDDEDNEPNINEDNDDQYTEKPLGVDVRDDDNDEGDPQDGEDNADTNQEIEGDEAFPDDLKLDQGPDDKDDDMDLSEKGEDNDAENPNNEEDQMDIDEEKDEDKDDENDNSDEKKELTADGGNVADPQVEDDTENIDMDIEDDKKPSNDYKPTFGIKNAAGSQSIVNSKEDDDEAQDPNNDNAKQSAGPKGEGNDNDGKGDSNSSSDEVGGENFDDATRDPNRKKNEPPNPFKFKGDVNEKWHKRLNIIKNDENEEEEEGGDGDEDVNPDDKKKSSYEHTKREEGSTQALAEAETEETVELPETTDNEKKENDKDDEKSNENNEMIQEEEEVKKDDKKREREGEKQQQKKKRKDDPNTQYNEQIAEQFNEDNDNNMDEQLENDSINVDDNVNNDEDIDMNDTNSKPGIQHTNPDFNFVSDKQVHFNDSDEIDESQELQLIYENARSDDMIEARNLWSLHKASSENHSVRLCEQLRLILEPTLATRLSGDYRTGKRIHMRRVINYIASGFRKDKIWLRRTKPAKRDYQIMLMIDNSSSMGDAGPIALSSLSTISNALSRLEVGELSVISFADEVKVVHPFGKPFDDEAGAQVFSHFDFKASRTYLGSSLAAVRPILANAKSASIVRTSSSSNSPVILQLCFIISDAKIDMDSREKLDHIIRSLAEDHVLAVLIIIDKCADPRDSIFNTKTVDFQGDKRTITNYMDNFPFPYYVAIQNTDSLPEVLSDSLKQWFEMIQQL